MTAVQLWAVMVQLLIAAVHPMMIAVYAVVTTLPVLTVLVCQMVMHLQTVQVLV